ncbi:MAG: M20/M25/M40 family metallo-hydrolase, partial [Anaerolineae bacterium]
MRSLIPAVLDLAVEIQQIPAPTFAEAQRAAFLLRRFREEGLRVEQDEMGNVYACLPGTGDARPVVVSAHSDTVFPPDTDLRVRRTAGKIHAPGIGDNSVAVAGLFGLLWSLREAGYTPPGDLWLVANVCEEGLGDLKGMRAVVRRFGSAPAAYVVLEGVALGTIFHRGLGVQRYRVHVRTAGGHSWGDFGRPSAIHELAEIVHRLTALPLPTQPRASLNVGVIRGGTSVNTIAAHAWLELDLRAEQAETLAALVEQVEALIRQASRADVQVSAEVIGRRPAGEIASDHPLVRLAVESLRAQGVSPQLSIGSTDANIPISQGLP